MAEVFLKIPLNLEEKLKVIIGIKTKKMKKRKYLLGGLRTKVKAMNLLLMHGATMNQMVLALRRTLNQTINIVKVEIIFNLLEDGDRRLLQEMTT